VATEQENLVLNVTLVDNASAGLDKLNQGLKQLGGEQQQSNQNKLRTNFSGLQNAIRPLVGDFSRLGTSLTGVAKAATTAIPAITGVGTAILGVSGIITAALIPIQRFASEMTDLGQLARETGHNAATIKMFREEFGKLFGSGGAQLADQTLRGLQRAMTDIQNPASKLREELAQGARHTPEMRADMDKLIATLVDAAKKGDTTEFFNLFTEGLDNINKNVSVLGRGPNVAAQWRNDLAKLAGIPEAVAATHAKLKAPTEEQIKNTAMLVDQSTQLTRSFDSMAVSVGKVSDAIKAIALGPDSSLVKGAQLLAGFMERIAAAADRWSKASIAGAEQPKTIDPNTGAEIPIQGPGIPPVDIDTGAPNTIPQRFSGGGSDTSLIEEENKRMADLTAEIKRLTDLLMVPTDRAQGSPFHNAPQGGAEGESNPIQIPDSVPQPGGGAAFEARGRKGRGGGNIISNFEGMMLPSSSPDISQEARRIAAGSGSSIVQLGLGRTGENIFTKQQFIDQRDPATRLGLPEQAAMSPTQRLNYAEGMRGFSTGYGVVYNPDLPTWKPTLAHELGHVGRRVLREDIQNLEPNIFRRYGIGSQPNIPDTSDTEKEELQQRALDLQVAQSLQKSGVISPGIAKQRMDQAYQYLDTRASHLPELTRHEAMLERSAKGILESGAKFNPKTGRSLLSQESMDRSVLDSTMGGEVSQHQVEGSATIDVNVKRSGSGNRRPASLFRMPRMERQVQGYQASCGPTEDISGGSNRGINT
jgi:hypothetical protein